MAEEVQATEKSWLPNLGILSNSSLEGLKPELQDQLQREATKRMLLGGLLSGGNFGLAFQSAVGTPTDYFARQQAIQAQNQQQQLLGARNAAYERVGLPYVQGSAQEQMLAQDVADFGPDAARTYAALESNKNLPKAFNKEKFAGLASQILAGSDPAKWAEFEKNIRPYTQEGNTYQTNPLTGKREFLPGMEKGEEPVFDGRGNVVGVRNMEGKISAVTERSVAEQAAQAMFNFEPVKKADGTTVLERKSDVAGYTVPGSFSRAPAQVSATPPAPQVQKPVQPTIPQKPTAGQAQPPQIPGFVPGVDVAPRPSSLSQYVKEQSAPEVAYQEGWKKVNDYAFDNWKAASGRSSTLQSLKNVMNRPDFDTNAFTNYKSQLLSFANASGIATDKQKDFVSNAATFRQGLNQIAAQAVTDLSGSTSNFDLEFSKDRFAKITDLKQSNQYAIDLLEASDKRKQDFYKFVQANRVPDVVTKWEQSEQGRTSIFESPSMRKYLPQTTIQSGEYKGQTAYKMPDGTVKVFPK